MLTSAHESGGILVVDLSLGAWLAGPRFVDYLYLTPLTGRMATAPMMAQMPAAAYSTP
jgi:hypothetical protein